MAMAVTCIGMLLGAACGVADVPAPGALSLSLVEMLGGMDTVGYTRAREIRDFDFPEDHGPHNDFRTEWWYVTGNVTGTDGREFGFQFTIFRNALAPSPPGGSSLWVTNQAYMGHFALTDVEGNDFRAAELFTRGTAYIAGARATPFSVWIEDWQLTSLDSVVGAESGSNTASSSYSAFPMRLRASAGGASVDLTLESGKPVVLQGDRGLSQKGPGPGDASYYYSHTRMPARGQIILDGDTATVSGLAWMDREWSTSSLSDGQVGWDWFALQFDDGWDMIVYRLRTEDGSADPLSYGALIDPAGRRVALAWGREVIVESTGRWTSPVDGTVYPGEWRIRVPARGWDFMVRPVVADQELSLAFRYWEGAVRVAGVGEGAGPVSGRGYVELTGYTPPSS